MNAPATHVLDRNVLLDSDALHKSDALHRDFVRPDVVHRDVVHRDIVHRDRTVRRAPTTRPPKRSSELGRPPLSVVQQHPDPDLRFIAGVDDDPGLLSAKLALCVIEILAGARSLDQLGRWVSDSVFVQLLRRTVIASRSREVTGEDARRPRVRVGEPMVHLRGESIVDAVVMIHQPTRSRAVALRLERHRQRWRATAITVL